MFEYTPLCLTDDLSDVESWHKGKILLIHKELNWTSYDIINKIKIALKYNLGIKKIKIGHAGTLDPRATGLMVVLTGTCTKLTDKIHLLSKTYLADIFMGATTPCFDTEQPIDKYYPINHISLESFVNKLEQFKGQITQYPPIHSAVKINGKTAYAIARKGIPFETRPRQVSIFDLVVTDFQLPVVSLKIQCSSGTYIRSLANDIGRSHDSGAYLQSLVRTSIGPWHLDQSIRVDQLIEKLITYKETLIS